MAELQGLIGKVVGNSELTNGQKISTLAQMAVAILNAVTDVGREVK